MNRRNFLAAMFLAPFAGFVVKQGRLFDFESWTCQIMNDPPPLVGSHYDKFLIDDVVGESCVKDLGPAKVAWSKLGDPNRWPNIKTYHWHADFSTEDLYGGDDGESVSELRLEDVEGEVRRPHMAESGLRDPGSTGEGNSAPPAST